MVLVNLTAEYARRRRASVPTVHVDPPASTAITVYAATAGATATLTEGNETDTDCLPAGRRRSPLEALGGHRR